jgi:hypothetical protein
MSARPDRDPGDAVGLRPASRPRIRYGPQDRLRIQLRYSLQFATSSMTRVDVHTCQFAAKVPNGRGFRQTVAGVRRHTAPRSAGVDR